MHAISTDALKGLGALTQAPCLSLYQPTHRSQPDNAQDRVEFRRGVEALSQALMAAGGAHNTQTLLDPFHDSSGRGRSLAQRQFAYGTTHAGRWGGRGGVCAIRVRA